MGLGTNEWACMRTASQRKLEGLRPQVLKLVENLTKWRRPPIGDLRLHHFEQIVSWMLGKGGHEQDIPPERIEPLSGPSAGAKGSWDSNRREAVYGAAAPLRTPSKRSWWAYQDSNSHLEVFSSDEEVDPDRVTAGAELSPGFSTELW